MDERESELIAEFSNVTGAQPDAARGALQASNWQLDEAVELFYTSQDGGGHEGLTAETPQAASQSQSVPAASSSSASVPTSRKQPAQSSSKLKTLRDLGGNGDEDSDEDEKQDFFAGGEKSGLAVQNPNSSHPSDLIKNIINQARQNRPRPGGDDDEVPERSSHFTGRAQTLGGDDAPSQVVEDPDQENADESDALPLVQRTLHLWNDGFSVDDGDLYRFDDPANAAAVATINQGRAPQSILNVQHNQRVDLNLIPHSEDYKQPARVYKPFGGAGQRLGTPTPGVGGSSSASAAPSTATTQSSQQPPSHAAAPVVDLDDSQPIVNIQIRLGDGSRLSSRFNTTHTVAQLFAFVDSSSGNPGRSYTLMTTFPSKELDDRAATLADVDALKKGGVVVQKWT